MQKRKLVNCSITQKKLFGIQNKKTQINAKGKVRDMQSCNICLIATQGGGKKYDRNNFR